MPDSWSERKKQEHEGKPHKGRGDVDNFCKGLLDALYSDDSGVWSVWIEKRWARVGGIEITEIV